MRWLSAEGLCLRARRQSSLAIALFRKRVVSVWARDFVAFRNARVRPRGSRVFQSFEGFVSERQGVDPLLLTKPLFLIGFLKVLFRW